jgi:hypothetical protein
VTAVVGEREHPSPVLAPSGAGVEEKESLAEILADSTVPWLTYAVHMGDAEMVAEHIEDLDQQQLLALAVVLAARCPQPLIRPNDGHVDDIAVERACAGEKVPLNRLERLAAVAVLLEWRLSHNEIGRRLHLSGNTTDRLIRKVTANALNEQDND